MSASRIQTAVEYAATAAERWRAQYASWQPEDRFSDGTTKADINEALNSNRHTPENITRIINEGWAYPECSCCGKRVGAVIQFTQDWGDEFHTICLACAESAVSMLGQIALSSLNASEGGK